jgi:hypothetical protein
MPTDFCLLTIPGLESLDILNEVAGMNKERLSKTEGILEYAFRAPYVLPGIHDSSSYILGVLVSYENWGLGTPDELFEVLGVQYFARQYAFGYTYREYLKVKQVFAASEWPTTFDEEVRRLAEIEYD